MENAQGEKITIICCGKSGVGKSTIGNQILSGDPKSNLFKQDKHISEYGLTRQIQGQMRKVTLPDQTKRTIQYLDVPGVGDPTVDVQAFVDEIQSKYQSSKINVALMLVTAQDNRKTLQEAFSCAFYRSFFEQNGLSSKQVLYLVITRWQECQMEDEDVETKLKSLASDGLEIDPSHVIKYRLGHNEDLLPIYEQIQTMNYNFGYNFRENLKQGLVQFQCEMDQIIGRNEELRYELDALQTQVKQIESENNNLKDLLKKNEETFEKARADEIEYRKHLLEILKNQKPIVIHTRSCTIF